MSKRQVAFLDVLGIRRALASGEAELADSKIVRLAETVEDVLPRYPEVHAHGATDFFIIWSSNGDSGLLVALATCEIFQAYFDLNPPKASPLGTYLLRAGIAYGEVSEAHRNSGRVTYTLLLGDGVAAAYEAQAPVKGMRIALAPSATQGFRARSLPSEARVRSAKVDRLYGATGNIEHRTIRWVGMGEEVERRVQNASWLFRKAVGASRKGIIPPEIVLHYQQTLCATLEGCSSPELLLRYLNYRYNHKRARPFLASIWATAWLRLLRAKHRESLIAHRDEIWEKFLIMSGSPMVTDVAQTLSRHNRWKPLVRFLRKGELRFGPKRRKLERRFKSGV